MTDLEILKKLLRQDAVLDIEKGAYGKKEVTLSEPKCDDHKGYSVVIRNMPEDAIVIKADTFPSPKTIFNNTRGECKRADFVIVANTDKENLFVVIEMKKGKGKTEKEVTQQLKGAQCLIAYCRSIGQVFWQETDFLNPENYIYRFVSIRYIGINKKPSCKPNLDGLHDSPERMLKISSPDYLQFKQLT